jgi:hypothetical protein
MPPQAGLGSEGPGKERQKTVKEQTRETVELGELIMAIFDEAAQHSVDPREVSTTTRLS